MYAKAFALTAALCCTSPLTAGEDKPEWAGNDLGMAALSPDYIDPNFAPLQIDGNTVVSGFKRLTVDRSGLPRSIAWRDSQMLRAPVRLAAAGVDADAFTGQLEKVGGNAARAHMQGAIEGLRYEVTADFDFDFTIRYTLAVTPVDGAVDVEKLSLVFPMNFTPEGEKLIMYYTEGPNTSESGVEAQARRIHRTIKGGDTEIVSSGFCSLFWVGTTEWGLSLNFESAQDWHPVRGEEITFDPATGDLTLNLIGKTATIDRPHVFKFFLTPTPVRDMPKNWRAWNYGWRGSPESVLPPEVNQLIYWSSTFRFHGYNNMWLRNPEELAASAVKDGSMHKAAYFIPQLITPRVAWEDDEGKYYLLEDPYLHALANKYQRTPGAKGRDLDVPADAIRFGSVDEYADRLGRDFIDKYDIKTQQDNRDVIFVPEIADHMVWSLKTFIDLGVGGIYYDGINPQQNYSPWAAWTDPDGNTRPFFHFEDMRALLKRMRYLVKQANPEEVIVAHQSGTRPGATLSLCDAIIPGETFFYWYHEPEKRDASPNGDFYYAYIVGDIDNLKGEFFHRQWGVPHILLPEVRGQDRKIFPDAARGTRTMLAYTLHFDMLYFPTMSDVREIYKIYRIRDAYGMADTNEYVVDFVPYWENQRFTTDDTNVKISYYDHVKEHELYSEFDRTKKYLVIVSNLQFDDSVITLSLPAELKKVVVKDMQSGATIPVENGKITHPLIAYDFALLEVTGETE